MRLRSSIRAGIGSAVGPVILVVLLGCCMPASAQGQRVEASRVAVRLESSHGGRRSAADLLPPDTSASRSTHVWEGALIGAGIGAATGIVVAFALTHQSSVTDHSEDALAYVFLVPVGVLAGTVIGAIFGAVRR